MFKYFFDPKTIPIVGHYLMTDSGLKVYTPQGESEHFQMNRNSLDLGKIPSGNFENFFSERPNVDLFAELKSPLSNKTSLVQLLKSDPQVKTEIENIFDLTEDTEKARTEYKENLNAVKRKANESTPLFSTLNFAEYLQRDIKPDAIEAIEAQQKTEKAKLNTLLHDVGFKASIQAMGLNDAQYDQMKTDMQAKLDQKHKESLDNFTKTLNDDINDFYKFAQRDIDRIAYLAERDRNDKNIRKFIDKRANELRAGGEENTIIAVGEDDRLARLKGIKVTDIPKLTSITGRSMQYDEQAHSFTILFSKRWVPSLHKKDDYDINSITQAVKACGYNTITMEIKSDDPEKAMELGRKAYEACLRSGFEDKDPEDPKKPGIQIKVNDKVMKIGDLFPASESKRLASARAKGEKFKAQREANLEMIKADMSSQTQNLRKEIARDRQLHENHELDEREDTGARPAGV